jgi:hypothetical protein
MPEASVISYPRLADILKGYLRDSADYCMVGGDCAALSAIHATIERFCADLEKSHNPAVLRPAGTALTFERLNRDLVEALERSEPSCALKQHCSAIARMHYQVDAFFSRLAEEKYVILASRTTAVEYNSDPSANSALVEASLGQAAQ